MPMDERMEFNGKTFKFDKTFKYKKDAKKRKKYYKKYGYKTRIVPIENEYAVYYRRKLGIIFSRKRYNVM